MVLWDLIETSHHRGGGAPGIAIGGTPGVPSSPASQGNAAANAGAADEKSCLPGLGTTAHSLAGLLADVHSLVAMAAWSSGFGRVASAGGGPSAVGARYTVGVP